MRRVGGVRGLRWLPAVGLVASTMVVPTPAQAKTPAVHVSVSVTPATAKVSAVAVVSGTVSSHAAGTALVLQRATGKRWVSVAHGHTGAGGHYAFHLRAPKTAATWAVRVSLAGATSATAHLRVVTNSFTVRATVASELTTAQPLVVTGSVTPKATGSVGLQSLRGKTWHTVGTAKLTKLSTFRLTSSLSAGSYKLRVTKAFSSTVAAGNSKTLAIAVTPTPASPTPPAVPPLVVSTTSLPAATLGVPYTSTLVATGGTAPYTWLAVGALPSGVTLSSTGAVSGFPAATGAFPFTAVVVDAAGSSATRSLGLGVAGSVDAGRTIVGWGSNYRGALGSSAVTGGTSSTPVPVDTLTGVVATAVANGSAYALRDDGTVWAWGRNDYDQLGDGTSVDRSSPVQVLGVSGITAIAAGTLGGFALRYDGTVWAWGVGVEGELGNGTLAATSTAVQVSGLGHAIAVAGGGSTGYALLSDGTVWAWGEGTSGQLGDGSSALSTTPVRVSALSGVTAIAAGAESGYAR